MRTSPTLGLRPVPADLRAVGRPGRPAGVDDHAVDAGLERRRRGEPDGQLRRGATPTPATFVVAEPLLRKVLGDDAEVLATLRRDARWSAGPTSARSSCCRVEDANYVVLADYVTTEDGTGLVHQAPAFGADDLAVGRAYGLPVRQPDRRATATSRPTSPLVGGRSSRTPTRPLVADLRARGLLFRHVPYTHSYPHCWRCHTPLMYYALPSWYVRTTAIKDRLLAENEATNWYPGDDQARPLRRLAEQQHRLGALARPLLGHAAAGVAQRRRPVADGVRRLAGRAARAVRRRTRRPAPAVRRRRHLHPARRGRAPTAACRR